MNEVQRKVFSRIIGFEQCSFNTSDCGTIKIRYNFGVIVFIQNDGNVFYEIDKMPKAHHFMLLIVSKLIQGIENILNESELV